MKIIVQKFGGTSVATNEARLALRKKVCKAIDSGYKPVVVVSAMGRKGAPYATDTLINLLKEENPNVDCHELDFLMSCGENISVAVVAANLQTADIKAQALTGGQAGLITDDQFGSAHILQVDTKYIRELLDKGIVPVVCGFQGKTQDNCHITTIGRGGSDTTAAALGAALHAEVVEIYTDVDGIMTADPHIVNEAELLECITYSEICQLAYQGAKVIHPRAVEIAMKKNIPLMIKSTFSDAPGTLITNDFSEDTSDYLPAVNRIASGVTYLDSVSQIKIDFSEEDSEASTKIFDVLAKNKINVDCLNVNPDKVVFTVDEVDLNKAIDLLKENNFTNLNTKKECAKVSVVGAGMRNTPGVMATFVKAFSQKNIPILQTVDSNITISAVIARVNLSQALTSLHNAFSLKKKLLRE